MSDDFPRGTERSKIDPENFVLRARPRRVIRFKRRLVVAIAAVVCVVVAGATWLALYTSGLRRHPGNHDLFSTSRKPTPDGLDALPGSYDQIKKPAPQLGPPLPGDLGPPIVSQEKSLGISPSLRPNPQDDADGAERMRLAQQARQAREAGVFFRLSPTNNAAAPPPTTSPPSSSQRVQNPPSATPVSASGRLNFDLERDQNDQQRKLDFLNQPPDRNVYNQHALQEPVSPYEVLAGTVISASLITGINSDLPGEVLAQVTANIFDTVTGRILLIPQGSKLIGTYDSVVGFGQSRALVIWQRIVIPDGSSIVIDNLQATDTAGYSGLADKVDYHTWRLLEGVGLSTLLGTGSQITFGNAQSDLVQAIRESTQDSINQAGQRITERNLNIQPTITVRPGWPIGVVVNKDLVLRPYRGRWRD